MGVHPDRKYVILASNEVGAINFNEVLEDSTETLRYSRENEYTFVKFEGDTPFFLEGKTQYTHEQILTLVRDPDNGWIKEEQM